MNTFIDSGVLIAAARGEGAIAERALADVETFKTVPALLTRKIVEGGKLLYGQSKMLQESKFWLKKARRDLAAAQKLATDLPDGELVKIQDD